MLSASTTRGFGVAFGVRRVPIGTNIPILWADAYRKNLCNQTLTLRKSCFSSFLDNKRFALRSARGLTYMTTYIALWTDNALCHVCQRTFYAVTSRARCEPLIRAGRTSVYLYANRERTACLSQRRSNSLGWLDLAGRSLTLYIMLSLDYIDLFVV